MSEDERDSFNASHIVKMLGELGSRGTQRLLVAQFVLHTTDGEKSILDLLINDWVEVQEGRYRYLAVDDCGKVSIKIVIAEYLACEVTWTP